MALPAILPERKGEPVAVNLVKGQKVDLKKPDGGDLRRIMIGLGWDPVERKKKLFAPQIDCDAFAMLLKGGKLESGKDIVAFFNLKHKSKSVKHSGDNLTGKGDGDDEQITVMLDDVPPDVDRIVFGANIYQARMRKQHFGMIGNAFIRIVDMDSGQELLRYDLSGDAYDGLTAMIFGEVYRRGDGWKFSAIGEATADGSIQDVAKRWQ